MNDEQNKRRVFLFIGIFAGLFGGMVAVTALPSFLNYAWEPVPNNTDLGVGMGGTGERQPNVTYFANEEIDLYLIGHVVGTGGKEVFEFNTSIDGVVVQDTLRDRTISTGLHEHFPQKATVPKGHNYTVMNSTNIFGIEWREYPYNWVKIK